MTANEDARCPLHDRTDCSPLLNGCNRLTSPDTSPTPVDLDVLEAACKETGQGLWHDVSLALIAELRSARIELADEIRWRNRILDRSRAPIGPDSERIRELEAEVASLRQDHFVVSMSGGAILTCVCRCGELLTAIGASNPDWLLAAHIKQERGR